MHGEDEALARSVLSFGDGLPAYAWPSVSNGKLSDLAAAAIIDRLERMPLWSPRYLAQRQRIVRLARQFELGVLGMYDTDTHAASVPVLAPAPVDLQELPDAGFDCRKYYAPLSDSSPMAASIYARIVNIPCHGDMTDITDQQVSAILRRMAQA